jgi:hypothetical protein
MAPALVPIWMGRDKLHLMTERQIALRDRIGDLMEVLDVILDNGIVGVEPDENDSRSYSIQALSETLGGLDAELRTSDKSEIASLEETFAEERRHILKIIGRLSGMAVAAAAAAVAAKANERKDALAPVGGD